MSQKIFDKIKNSKLRTSNIVRLDQNSHLYAINSLAGILKNTLHEASSKFDFKIDFWSSDTFSKNTKIFFSLRPTADESDEIKSVDVIVDNYLTETLNALNLLYFHKASISDNKKYICKLVAEEFFCLGLTVNAMSTIKKYTSLKYGFQGELDKETSRKAASYTALQQMFILLHEFSHLLFKCNLISDSKFNWFKENLIIIMKENTSANEAEIEKYISENKKIFEECYCDSFAVEVLFEIINDLEESYNFKDICESIALSIHQLHILERIKEAVKGREIDLSLQLIIRQLFLNTFMSMQCFKHSKTDLFSSEAFRKQVTSTEKDIMSQTDVFIINTIAPYTDNLISIANYYYNKVTNELILDVIKSTTTQDETIDSSDQLDDLCFNILMQLI